METRRLPRAELQLPAAPAASGRQDGGAQKEACGAAGRRAPRGPREPAGLLSRPHQVLGEAAGVPSPLPARAPGPGRCPLGLAAEAHPLHPQRAPILHGGGPGPPPGTLRVRPVCGAAGEAGPGRGPPGTQVGVFPPQACSGLPGRLRAVPEGAGGAGRLGAAGPAAGVHREPPRAQRRSQVDPGLRRLRAGRPGPAGGGGRLHGGLRPEDGRGGDQGQGGGGRPRRGGLGEGDAPRPPARAAPHRGRQPARAGAGAAQAGAQGAAQLLRLAAPRVQDGTSGAAAQEVRGGQAAHRADAGAAQVPALLSRREGPPGGARPAPRLPGVAGPGLCPQVPE